ncbi:alpha-amylase family glycosyl hydrolase [Wenzhouxiangella sp. AB-CW3]|uniref:alpha-amylase family glycosyl hydrolase n=1 Tax=Wenzhouxiangella sp. AB-CW3 TaxID=2771012 RepID=UPI001CC28623|nr:alpha-amylase family glycosyl hydrolase [Wenzhouxiangella sp. AB-CW3]
MSRLTAIRNVSFMLVVVAGIAACGSSGDDIERNVSEPTEPEAPLADIYGTLEPFAAEAIYFVMTDRFVNGDPDNDHRDQGGEHPTFDIPLPECDGVAGNIGYLGGDFRGLLDHADYIREMGFTAVWITPIADNPDQAFAGGDEIECDSMLTDHGKTGYHGYWATNFYQTDEHLVSPGLDFPELTAGMAEAELKVVLDIVGNHGSPGWTMPEPQPGFGQLFDADGKLIADHENRHPNDLDPENKPLHAFFRTEPSLAELASFDPDNPEVVEYLIGAFERWVEQGAAAFRIDTMAYMPKSFWKEVSDRIGALEPGFFMFGEVWSEDPEEIAPYTHEDNGGFSALDFPLQGRLREVFEDPDGDFARLDDYLHLDHTPYRNAYELVTFYDNHDMARFDGGENGLINVHNWLFTARGIPSVYYGSEMAFKAGRAEHQGNRNYFGVAGIEKARHHPVREALTRIARLRENHIALQKGRQVMLELQGHRAAFYRVFQHDGVSQTALVLLNKGPEPQTFSIGTGLQSGRWNAPLNGDYVDITEGESLDTTVPPTGIKVYVLEDPVTDPELLGLL